MPRKTIRSAFVLAAFAGWVMTPALMAEADARGLSVGTPDVASVGALAFSDDGVLFVGDAKGGAIFAISIPESKTKATDPPRIPDLDSQLAGLLGTTVREVVVHDLAVHPHSLAVYLSVSRGRGAEAQPVLVRILGEGIEVLSLEDVRFAKVPLARVPDADAKDRRGRSLRATAITDLKFYDGKLYVAGLSNEEFASSLRTIAFPFVGEGAFNTVEIYHGAHGQYETHAPIRTLLPIELDGKDHLLASYTCTPLVTLLLESLEDGKHVKGKTVAELGAGNSPLDMLAFEKEGRTFVYMINNRRGGMKIDAADIVKADAISAPLDEMLAGVPYLPMPLAGAIKMANFNDEAIVLLRRDIETGGLLIRGVPKRFL
jgi:hypothetical protein